MLGLKDFILWDKTHNEFLNADYIKGIAFDNGKLHYIATNRKQKGLHSDLFNEEVEFLYGIGLKDINDKSIYAYSSIVEFTIREDGIKLPVNGYFKFDPIFLRYYIRIIEDKGVENRYYLGLQVVPWDKYCDYIRDIKIIDTIQENKLGLIK